MATRVDQRDRNPQAARDCAPQLSITQIAVCCQINDAGMDLEGHQVRWLAEPQRPVDGRGAVGSSRGHARKRSR